jgi:hypothetical protein
MATYLNDLRLTELATGEGSGTWGTTTNLSLELIGEALGFATQQVFGSDADATTTIADGASDPARAMYFKITSAGSLTATRTCTIAPNTVSRVMFIENATTGSQSIAISQGSGASVTILAGKTAVVYLDGAGAGAAVVDAMAGVDPGVTDTLAEVLAAGNTSGANNLIIDNGQAITTNTINETTAASGVTIDSVLLKDDGVNATNLEITNIKANDGTSAGSIADSTGVVTLASSVLTTADINGGTIDGTTLGATTPASVAATTGSFSSTLGVTGAATFSSTVAGAFNGTLGATTPASVAATTGTFSGNTTILPSSDGDALIVGKSGGSNLHFFSNAGASLITNAAGAGAARDGFQITSGNVLTEIDTVAKLSVSAAEVVVNDTGADTDFRVESSGNANMLFVDGGENAVGIGTIPPAWRAGLADVGFNVGVNAALYDQTGGSVFLVNNWYRADNNTLTYRNTNEAQYMSMEAGEFSFANAASGSAGAAITFTERMKIDASGGLITNPAAGGHAVFNEAGVDADFRVESDTNTHAIYVDAGNNSVTLGSSSSASNTFRVSFGGFQAATDASFSTTKSYTFRDGVGIDNPNSSSFSTATAAVLCVGAMTSGRSINATGTINASGADYAEYEANNGLVISKGSIVGFKADGTLTLTFSEAVRFAVKSTDPAYVGGDTWADVEPPEKNTPAWDTWFAEAEAKRAKVDRVAYSGKVPVNVQGATAGQYIIAVANSSGEITGQAVTDPDFSQYKLSVGRVNKVLEDGRAEVAVIIH